MSLEVVGEQTDSACRRCHLVECDGDPVSELRRTRVLLAGVGEVDVRRRTNYLVVGDKTTTKQIEEAFKEMTSREDVAVVLISQFAADSIRYLVNEYDKPIPAVLEIPSKDRPYDATKDSVLQRVQHLMGAEDAAAATTATGAR